MAKYCAETGSNVVFALHRGVDLVASDIASQCTSPPLEGLGYVACCKACSTTLGCGGFVFSRPGNRCWLKGWGATIIKAEDAENAGGEPLSARAQARIRTFVAGVREEGVDVAALGGAVVRTAALDSAAPPPAADRLPRLRDRLDFGALLQTEGRLTVGVQLGGRDGKFAAAVLGDWPSCTSYTLVGTWAPIVAGYGRDLAPARVHSDKWAAHTAKLKLRALEAESQELALVFARAKRELRTFGPRVRFDRRAVAGAAPSFANRSIDFIYVDAHRDFGGTAADIARYWPKLRDGGIMAGYGYIDVDEAGDTPHDWGLQADGTREEKRGVRSAVDAFAQRAGVDVHQVECDDMPTWYVRKGTVMQRE